MSRALPTTLVVGLLWLAVFFWLDAHTDTDHGGSPAKQSSTGLAPETGAAVPDRVLSEVEREPAVPPEVSAPDRATGLGDILPAPTPTDAELRERELRESWASWQVTRRGLDSARVATAWEREGVREAWRVCREHNALRIALFEHELAVSEAFAAREPAPALEIDHEWVRANLDEPDRFLTLLGDYESALAARQMQHGEEAPRYDRPEAMTVALKMLETNSPYVDASKVLEEALK